MPTQGRRRARISAAAEDRATAAPHGRAGAARRAPISRITPAQELAEAREQLAATSEILRVISRSPTDAQPVFDTIARAAMRLCKAGSANVFTFDGSLLQIATVVVAVPEAEAAIRSMFPRLPDRGSVASRAVQMRSVVAIPDVTLDPNYAVRGVGELGFRSVVGAPLLRDGEPIGAIAGTICDGSYPTFLLTHWVRDRRRGPRLPLPQVVKWLARDTARAVGLEDRGLIAPGYKADLNVLDLDGMALHAPEVVHDLPAGGRRLVQRAEGYAATIVSGTVVQRDGMPTGALPGRLVRGPQAAVH